MGNVEENGNKMGIFKENEFMYNRVRKQASVSKVTALVQYPY